MRKEKKGMRQRVNTNKEKRDAVVDSAMKVAERMIKKMNGKKFLNKLQKDSDYVNFGYLKNRKKIKKMRGVINYFTTNIK